MADRISVSTQLLEQSAHELDALKTVIDDVSGILTGIDTSKGSGGDLKVSVGGLSGSTAAEVTRSLRKAMRNGGENIKDIASAVRKSVQIFEEAEERNRQIVLGNVKSTSSYSGNKGSNKPATPSHSTDPFDDEGQFGGYQVQPFADRYAHTERLESYKQIIEHNTGHTFANYEELYPYLERMNSEGCGYIAIVNSIFAAFKDDPDGFEEAFGFEMYKDGELNYNELFVDLYSSWDNKNKNGEFMPEKDQSKEEKSSGYSYWTDVSGPGPTPKESKYIAEQYLRDHGVQAEATLHRGLMTAEKYNKLVDDGKVKQGQVQVFFKGTNRSAFLLYDENGKPAKSVSAGHAMVVTGTKDGMLVVSSWGEKYYVRPEDVPNNLGYMILDIEN